jgi:DNA-binding SARP family transcriptional activator
VAVDLRVLGRPDLLDDNGKSLHAVVVQPKRFGLLVFLALSRPAGFHRRDELLAMFWPDQSEQSARNALNQALSFLRRSLGSDALPSRGPEEVGVDQALISCDALAFLDAADRGDEEGALARYVGELLPAFHVDDAPAFGDWLDQERRLLRDRALATAKVLATRAESHGEFTHAIEWALRGTVLAPCDETLARQLVVLHDRSGNPGRAIQVYDEYAARIWRELELEPSPNLRALIGEIRSRSLDRGPASAPAVDAIASALVAPRADTVNVAQSTASDLPATIDRQYRQSTKPVSATHRKPAVRWRKAAIAVGSAALVVVGGALAMRRPTDRVREFVVVADIATPPGDTAIADMLTDDTRRALSDSRSIAAAPGSRVAAARLRLGVPTEQRLTVPLARQVALGEGIRSVVAGSLQRFGAGYALSLRLISASSGDVLFIVDRIGLNEKELNGALDTLTRTLRERAGDDVELIRAQPSLTALTSTSLEAMSLYVAALRGQPDDKAIERLRQAVALDPSFAAALWQLATRRTERVTDDERRGLLARAYTHRDGLTEYERLRVEADYQCGPNGLTPDRARLIERVRQIVDVYPNYEDAMWLGGAYWDKRDLASAESMLTRAITLDSTRFGTYVRLMDVYLARNEIRAARKLVDVAMRRFPGMELYEATTAYAEGRRARMREVLQQAAERGKVWSGGELYLNLAWLNLLEGQVAEWQRDYPSSITRDSAASRLLMLAADYWVHNRPAEGLRMLDAELAAHPEQRRSPDAAILYAQFNRPSRARSVLAAYDSAQAGEVKHSFGQATGRRTAMGWILVAEGKPLDAIAELRGGQMAADGPAGPSPIAADAEVGLAFERAGQPDSAIAAYEHYLNTPYPDRFFDDGLKLAWVLEHAGSLHEMQGNRKKARAAYSHLVDLWKNADPELQPRVTHAQQRLTLLRGWKLLW